MVAGQRDLEAAAERGAVDRGDDRLAEGLEPAQRGLDPLGRARRPPGRRRGPALTISLRLPPAKKVFFALVDDDAGDGRPASAYSRSTAAAIEST